MVEHVRLRPPRGAGQARGRAVIRSQGGYCGLAIVAHDLEPNGKKNAYAVWLYNSKTHNRLLGFVSPPVNSSGRLHTAGRLPKGFRRFHQLIISLETPGHPSHPHHVVLIGRLIRHRGFTG